MPIRIIDNFTLNSALPIDGRMVATNSTHRDAMPYKYDGMKVFQSDIRTTYVWDATAYASTGLTSSSWVSEQVGFQGPQGRAGFQGVDGFQGLQGQQGVGYPAIRNPQLHAVLTATASDPTESYSQPNFTFDGSSISLLTNIGASGPTISGGFQVYSEEVSAGNDAPHFRTGNGDVIRLYGQDPSVSGAGFTAGSGITVTTTDTFDGYTIAQVVRALRNIGLLD